jgi:TonB family protein
MIGLDDVIKVTLLMGVALAACLTLRHRSAATRHWTIASALLATLLIPALSRLTPEWRIPALERFVPAPPAPEVAVQFTIANSAEQPSTIATSQADSPPERRRLGLIDWAVGIWIAGATVMIIVLAAGLARLWWLARRARILTRGPWHEALTSLTSERGIRPVTVLQSDHPTLLVTWGTFQPKVLLPAPAHDWSPARIRVVLRHELAHIRRGDWLAQLVAEAVKALHWYNPLVWIACRRLRTESELACDAELMHEGLSGPEYASELLELARALNAPRTSWTAALAMARPSSLEGRVTAMLTEHLDRQPIQKRTRALAIVAAIVVATALAGFNVLAQSFSTVSGSVTNQIGGVIPGATVVLTSLDKERKYEVKADANGQYQFLGVLPGDYTLSNLTPGFKYGGSPIRVAGNTVRRDLSLEVGTLEETISVKAGSGPSRPVSVASQSQPIVKPAEACTPTSGGTIKQPTKIADKRPIYPENLAASQAGGLVVLNAVIGTDGAVKEATPKDDTYNSDLVAAAIAAVKQWRFTPTLLNCVPIDVQMTVTVRFSAE